MAVRTALRSRMGRVVAPVVLLVGTTVPAAAASDHRDTLGIDVEDAVADLLGELGVADGVRSTAATELSPGVGARLEALIDAGFLSSDALGSTVSSLKGGRFLDDVGGLVEWTRARRTAFRDAAFEALDLLGVELEDGQTVRDALAAHSISDAELAAVLESLGATMPPPPHDVWSFLTGDGRTRDDAILGADLLDGFDDLLGDEPAPRPEAHEPLVPTEPVIGAVPSPTDTDAIADLLDPDPSPAPTEEPVPLPPPLPTVPPPGAVLGPDADTPDLDLPLLAPDLAVPDPGSWP